MATNTPSLVRPATWSVLGGASLLAMSGCTVNVESETTPSEPTVDPIVVPERPALREGTSTCFPLRTNDFGQEEFAGVTTEGHAWLAGPNPDGFEVRVRDALRPGEEPEIGRIRVLNAAQLQAWSHDDATILDDDKLWSVQDLLRTQISVPPGISDDSSFCGDPATNGFLLGGGVVYERRDDDQWWAWTPESESVPDQLHRNDGECVNQSGVTWMSSADGTLWRVEAGTYSRPRTIPGLQHVSVSGDLVAALDDAHLWIGPQTWQPYVFPKGLPTQLSASHGHVWMMSGDQLLRFDGDTFVEVPHPLTGPVHHLRAYPSGVWLADDAQICHVAIAPLLRIEGLRPFQRTVAQDHEIIIDSDRFGLPRSNDQVTLALDGESVQLEQVEHSLAYRANVRLEALGWHELVVTTPDTLRSLFIKHLPSEERSWETDIKPLYDANCVTGDCHGTNANAPAFDTLASWRQSAAAIRARVVENNAMPPASNRGPDWGDDDVTIVAEWLAGGMKP